MLLSGVLYSCPQVSCTLAPRYLVLLTPGTVAHRYLVLLTPGILYSCPQVSCTVAPRYLVPAQFQFQRPEAPRRYLQATDVETIMTAIVHRVVAVTAVITTYITDFYIVY